MRTFFVSLLKDLKRLTGVKQYEEIASNPNGKEAAQAELDALLEPMIEVCNQYSYISDEDKMKIIKAAIINAKEFYGLNARFVRLALEAVKDIYFKESGYLETNALLNAKESNAVPLEECSPETQAMVKEFTAKLAVGGIQKITDANEHELKSIQSEDEFRVKPKAYSTSYKPLSENEIKIRDMHVQWIRECIHPQTKELIGLGETEWLLDKGYFIENGEIKEL